MKVGRGTAALSLGSSSSFLSATLAQIVWRYVLTTLLFLGNILLFAMKANLSVAIIAMVNQTAITNQSGNSATEDFSLCHADDDVRTDSQTQETVSRALFLPMKPTHLAV
ncbi:unnamed protein product [Soboliphyme baturini]|uniref:Uncharacterized protein n=1 Tax=Soboliphyme baturini TaxID=241478 RepID=A0A183IR86_9BILA|nr:unnamed protein product [Soboliphyme baturini]